MSAALTVPSWVAADMSLDPEAGAGWRTGWTDSMHVGQGFHRDSSKGAGTAIVYNPDPEPEKP